MERKTKIKKSENVKSEKEREYVVFISIIIYQPGRQRSPPCLKQSVRFFQHQVFGLLLCRRQIDFPSKSCLLFFWLKLTVVQLALYNFFFRCIIKFCSCASALSRIAARRRSGHNSQLKHFNTRKPPCTVLLIHQKG